ncbi:RtcB family protein [Candidatus Pacearchaeota archaeon]|nr:RtcB family protein [Candidatus Pacearchaeota archaeon]
MTMHTTYSNKPVTIYGIEGIEDKALNQLRECMTHPFSLAGAAMPDMHLGYTMPIGGVILTDRHTLVPSWVGYDIGCGVSAIRTTFDAWEIRGKTEEIFNNVYRSVPTGRNWHKEGQNARWLTGVPLSPWLEQTYEESGASKQIGTLGSGNHFIEVGVGEDERVWIIVHSGSRNLGHKTASRYIAEACGHATGVYKQKEGSHPLIIGTMEGDDYETDLAFCQEFALLNRRAILDRVAQAIKDVAVSGDIQTYTLINKNHNSAELAVTPMGTGYIHRKGATNASEGVRGVIPGNMRDGTYIVRGRGNTDSLFSASHGAGRKGSRKQAKLETTLEEFENAMVGVKAKVSLATLDENPMAYKNFIQVMRAQRDLVEILTHIEPLINIKA